LVETALVTFSSGTTNAYFQGISANQGCSDFDFQSTFSADFKKSVKSKSQKKSRR